MKFLTLNTHSLQEDRYAEKLEQFVETVLREKPDLIAMQEVNQTASAAPIGFEYLIGKFPIPGARLVRSDNHAAQVAARLREAGIACHWAWLPIKLGYSKYDEGVAILSLGRPIAQIHHFPISRTNDYDNWRTRAVLGVRLEGMTDWFYTVHMGWWGNQDESFQGQWHRLTKAIVSERGSSRVWLLGDFNAPDAVRGESYDLVLDGGWYDTFALAKTRDSGITVPGIIDGWRDRLEGNPDGMRLDYIFCSREAAVKSSRVIFNGTNAPIVSDHFGVMVETEE